uniref:Uncharacterized protein n=1 Tax=Musca domestica TaxID=7370 RepID=A0A1I8MTG0_MUSDO
MYGEDTMGRDLTKSLPQNVQQQLSNRQRNAKMSYQNFEVNDRIADGDDWELSMPPKAQTHSLNNLKTKVMAITTTRKPLMEALVLNSGIENQEDAVETLLPMDLKNDYRQHLQEMKETTAATGVMAARPSFTTTNVIGSSSNNNNNKITRNNIKANYQDNRDLVTTPDSSSSSSSYSSSNTMEMLFNDRHPEKKPNITDKATSATSPTSSTSLSDSLLDYVLLEYMTKTKQNLTRILESNKDSAKERNSTLTTLSNFERIQQQLEFLQKNADKLKKFQQVEERKKNASLSPTMAIESNDANELGERDGSGFKEATQNNDNNFQIDNKGQYLGQTIGTNEGGRNNMKENTNGDEQEMHNLNTAMNLSQEFQTENTGNLIVIGNLNNKTNKEDKFQDMPKDDKENNKKNNTIIKYLQDVENAMRDSEIVLGSQKNNKNESISNNSDVAANPVSQQISLEASSSNGFGLNNVSPDTMSNKQMPGLVNSSLKAKDTDNSTESNREIMVESIINNLKTLSQSSENNPTYKNSSAKENVAMISFIKNLENLNITSFLKPTSNETVASDKEWKLGNNEPMKQVLSNHQETLKKSEDLQLLSQNDHSEYLPYVDEDKLLALIKKLKNIRDNSGKENDYLNGDQQAPNDSTTHATSVGENVLKNPIGFTIEMWNQSLSTSSEVLPIDIKTGDTDISGANIPITDPTVKDVPFTDQPESSENFSRHVNPSPSTGLTTELLNEDMLTATEMAKSERKTPATVNIELAPVDTPTTEIVVPSPETEVPSSELPTPDIQDRSSSAEPIFSEISMTEFESTSTELPTTGNNDLNRKTNEESPSSDFTTKLRRENVPSKVVDEREENISLTEERSKVNMLITEAPITKTMFLSTEPISTDSPTTVNVASLTESVTTSFRNSKTNISADSREDLLKRGDVNALIEEQLNFNMTTSTPEPLATEILSTEPTLTELLTTEFGSFLTESTTETESNASKVSSIEAESSIKKMLLTEPSTTEPTLTESSTTESESLLTEATTGTDSNNQNFSSNEPESPLLEMLPTEPSTTEILSTEPTLTDSSTTEFGSLLKESTTETESRSTELPKNEAESLIQEMIPIEPSITEMLSTEPTLTESSITELKSMLTESTTGTESAITEVPSTVTESSFEEMLFTEPSVTDMELEKPEKEKPKNEVKGQESETIITEKPTKEVTSIEALLPHNQMGEAYIPVKVVYSTTNPTDETLPAALPINKNNVSNPEQLKDKTIPKSELVSEPEILKEEILSKSQPNVNSVNSSASPEPFTANSALPLTKSEVKAIIPKENLTFEIFTKDLKKINTVTPIGQEPTTEVVELDPLTTEESTTEITFTTETTSEHQKLLPERITMTAELKTPTTESSSITEDLTTESITTEATLRDLQISDKTTESQTDGPSTEKLLTEMSTTEENFTEPSTTYTPLTDSLTTEGLSTEPSLLTEDFLTTEIFLTEPPTTKVPSTENVAQNKTEPTTNTFSTEMPHTKLTQNKAAFGEIPAAESLTTTTVISTTLESGTSEMPFRDQLVVDLSKKVKGTKGSTTELPIIELPKLATVDQHENKTLPGDILTTKPERISEALVISTEHPNTSKSSITKKAGILTTEFSASKISPAPKNDSVRIVTSENTLQNLQSTTVSTITELPTLSTLLTNPITDLPTASVTEMPTMDSLTTIPVTKWPTFDSNSDLPTSDNGSQIQHLNNFKENSETFTTNSLKVLENSTTSTKNHNMEIYVSEQTELPTTTFMTTEWPILNKAEKGKAPTLNGLKDLENLNSLGMELETSKPDESIYESIADIVEDITNTDIHNINDLREKISSSAAENVAGPSFEKKNTPADLNTDALATPDNIEMTIKRKPNVNHTESEVLNSIENWQNKNLNNSTIKLINETSNSTKELPINEKHMVHELPMIPRPGSVDSSLDDPKILINGSVDKLQMELPTSSGTMELPTKLTTNGMPILDQIPNSDESFKASQSTQILLENPEADLALEETLYDYELPTTFELPSQEYIPFDSSPNPDGNSENTSTQIHKNKYSNENFEPLPSSLEEKEIKSESPEISTSGSDPTHFDDNIQSILWQLREQSTHNQTNKSISLHNTPNNSAVVYAGPHGPIANSQSSSSSSTNDTELKPQDTTANLDELITIRGNSLQEISGINKMSQQGQNIPTKCPDNNNNNKDPKRGKLHEDGAATVNCFTTQTMQLTTLPLPSTMAAAPAEITTGPGPAIPTREFKDHNDNEDANDEDEYYDDDDDNEEEEGEEGRPDSDEEMLIMALTETIENQEGGIEKWSTFKNNHLNNGSLTKADNGNDDDAAVQMEAIMADENAYDDVHAAAGSEGGGEVPNKYEDGVSGSNVKHFRNAGNVNGDDDDDDNDDSGDAHADEGSINDKDAIRPKTKVNGQDMVNVETTSRLKDTTQMDTEDADIETKPIGQSTNNEFKITATMEKNMKPIHTGVVQGEVSTIETKLLDISKLSLSDNDDMVTKNREGMKEMEFNPSSSDAENDEINNGKIAITGQKDYKGNEKETLIENHLQHHRPMTALANDEKQHQHHKKLTKDELEKEFRAMEKALNAHFLRANVKTLDSLVQQVEQLSQLADIFLGTETLSHLQRSSSHTNGKPDTSTKRKKKHQPTLKHILTSEHHSGREEITPTNWWHSLPYAEITKFLNSIFDTPTSNGRTIAAGNGVDLTLSRSPTKRQPSHQNQGTT